MRIALFLALIFSSGHIRMLYNSLDPSSLHEHLAFWELYPDSPEGKKALQDISRILDAPSIDPNALREDFKSAVEGMISLVNKPGGSPLPRLSDSALDFVKTAGQSLANRRLKGFYARSEEEVLQLDPSQVDLARGLFLSEMGSENFDRIHAYEALLDLMALQIKSRLSPHADNKEKVRRISHYIFEELGFRFPPHSTYSEEIDLYTFLPSVMDSRQGVCLGVSILYIALSQRLDLPLEMVTPPGHIYVRSGNLNIETTARGANFNDEVYLGVDTRSLQTRNVKEVIGLAHFNRAAIFWRKKDPQKAIEIYSKARLYLNEDPLLLELLAYNYLLLGDEENGVAYLEKIKDHLPDHTVSPNSVPGDYLTGKADKEALAAVFLEVDEKRSSLLQKKEALEKTVKRCPEFKAAWFQLGSTYLQLHRMKESLGALRKVHELSQDDATTEYYLAVLNAERGEFKEAWKHLKQAEELVAERNHEPKALQALRRELTLIFPDGPT